MAVEGPLSAVHLPRLTAELPVGWTVSEGATFTAPDGTVIRVRVDDSGGATADELARAHLEAISEELGPVEIVRDDGDAVLAGLLAHEVRFTVRFDDDDWVGQILVAVDGHRSIAAWSNWKATDVEGPSHVERGLAGIRLSDRLVPATAETAPAAESGDPAPANFEKPDRVADPAIWVGLRPAWTRSLDGAPPPALTDEQRWSDQELATLAALCGIDWFPTVGSDVLGALSDEARTATLTASIRSLVARGLLVIIDDAYAPASPQESMLRLAASPELTVHLERMDRHATRVEWYGLTPDSAMRISSSIIGVRTTSVFDCEDLVSLVVADAALPLDAASHPTEAVEILTWDDITSDSSDVRAFVQVRTGWWDGKVALGGLLAWIERDDGRLELAEPVTEGPATRWRVSPTDAAAVHEQILVHLPGMTS